MKIKVDEDINFDGWIWTEWETNRITEAWTEAWKKVEKAIARNIAEVVRDQFVEDGIEVELVNWGEDDAVRALISVTPGGLSVGPGSAELLTIYVPVAQLLDELIAEMPTDARELIPEFRAMLTKLEAIPHG